MANRISLYEAIRRKGGLVRQSQGGPGDTKPAEPDKPAVKPQVAPKPSGGGKTLVSGLKKPLADGRAFITGLKKPLAGSAAKVRTVQSALSVFWKGLFEDISWLWWAGITAGLLVLLFFVFILGMEYQRGRGVADAAESGSVSPPAKRVGDADRPGPSAVSRSVPETVKPVVVSPVQKKEPLKTEEKTGTNTIVIVAYTKKDDLKPVQEYLGKNGIDTDILQRGAYFLLVTKRYFDNPDKEGTDGFRMKEQIKRLGAAYKAPDGYERFGTTPFQDAYGMKIK